VLPEALLEGGAAGASEQLRAAADDAAAAAALNGEDDIDEDEAEGAAETAAAAAAAADELDALSAELSAWRSYFALDARLRAWSGRYEAHSSSQPPSVGAPAAGRIGMGGWDGRLGCRGAAASLRARAVGVAARRTLQTPLPLALNPSGPPAPCSASRRE
jgi:hypothetical protein